MIETRKREHSRKPDELYPIIEACSPGPYLELFARGTRRKWTTFGNQSRRLSNHMGYLFKPQSGRRRWLPPRNLESRVLNVGKPLTPSLSNLERYILEIVSR